jgi:predicted TIM-barrel fold metal-dependent hydrolase
MFETDFPHPTCLYPNAREAMETAIGDLDETVQRKLLYETASRVYQIDLDGR